MKKYSNDLRRWLWLGIGAILLFNTAFLISLSLFAYSGPQILVTAIHTQGILGWLLGALFCFYRLPRQRGGSSPHKHHLHSFTRTFAVRMTLEWVPLWVGLVFLTHMISEGISTFYSLYTIQPEVDWSNIPNLLQYPFLLLAILSLPGHRPASATRVRMLLDAVMIITALITFSWYFLLGPIMLYNHTPLAIKLIEAAFPFGDIVLCYCLIQVWLRGEKAGFKAIRQLLLPGLACILIANSIAGYRFEQLTQHWVLLESLIRSAGNLLIALGVYAISVIDPAQLRTVRAKTDAKIALAEKSVEASSDLTASIWHSWLAYAFVPAVGVLMFIVWQTDRNGGLLPGVCLGGMILVALVILRQILVLQETVFYNRELRHMRHQLSINNQALYEANTRLEEQARDLVIAYEQQRQLNELKNQFLLNVNHELRTPLTEIYGSLELLQSFQERLDQETHALFLSHALNGCEELLRLVNTVLDALKSDSDETTCQWEELCIATEVNGVLKTFDPQKLQAYPLDLEIPTGLAVKADRRFLHQILCNLLSNAFNYAPPHSPVTIGARAEMVGDIVQKICIWVQDAGPGISPGDIPLLFGKFVRLKQDLASSVRGTGLGLYISKQLVEAMGGRIWVESAGVAGQGSRFTFTLPAPH